MADAVNTDNIHEKLTALADGELDAAHSLLVWDYLAAHPEALQWMRDQQRLTIAARRVLRSPGEAPAALAAKIAAMRMENSQAATKPLRWSGSSRLQWWQAVAAVVLIAAGILIGHDLARTGGEGGHDSGAAGAAVIPAEVVAQATRVHAVCSRLVEALHSAGFPESLGTLAADVEQDVHSGRPNPNLASMGYRYTGAGPCNAPANTVHLLYHSMKPGSISTVSVFVQEYTGQFPLDVGRVYTVSVAESPFPMLVWRTEKVIYFLIADNETTERQALAVIRGTDPVK